MQNHSLAPFWTVQHIQAFLALKQVLISEPVLQQPKWDGTPFIVTSDGCKEGFGAVLTQVFTTTLPNGHTVTKCHPIAFASKCTSRSEANHKPFLLEFAALKYALDQFSDIIWGYPVELETDCQALRDDILNERLNTTHARWRDGIIAYYIVDVRHVPGKVNVVADGISRSAEDIPRLEGVGSGWSVSKDWETLRGLVHDIFLAYDPSALDNLCTRFAKEPIYLEVIDALLNLDDDKPERDQKRAQHCALQYVIDKGKLWRLCGGNRSRARTRTECVFRTEAVEPARQQHADGGHWGQDSVKIALMDWFHSPGLGESILEAIRSCPECKNFGSTHLHFSSTAHHQTSDVAVQFGSRTTRFLPNLNPNLGSGLASART